MIFEWMSDPAAWFGLATLIVLEVVLGIDNLVFIAILAEKLPPEQRDKARMIGLSLALIMRLGLLASMVWIMSLTHPIPYLPFEISVRDIILIVGGLFLLFKGTMELHERLEGKMLSKEDNPVHAAFWMVIIQIVVMDAIFSIDSILTAVGMVKHLSVMMIAVVIAMIIMLIASKPLMDFVNKHPTVVILCLGFLMMIGFSLVVEGLGFHIPKGYLYAAIGFSVLVEFINQTMRKNQEKMVTTTDLRYRTASAVLRMLGGKSSNGNDAHEHHLEDVLATHAFANEVIDDQNAAYHSVMVQGVLSLSERPIKSLMTPRPELEWIDLEQSLHELKQQLMGMTHSRLIVARGELDNIEGIVLTHKVLNEYIETGVLDFQKHLREAVIVHENAQVLMVMEQLRQAPLQLAIVLNEYGSIEGIVTPIDVLEAIAGEFPDEDELENATESLQDGSLMLEGSTDIRHVSLLLGRDLVDDTEEYSTLSGFILSQLGRLPENGEHFEAEGYRFEVVTMDGHKIDKVHVVLANQDDAH